MDTRQITTLGPGAFDIKNTAPMSGIDTSLSKLRVLR